MRKQKMKVKGRKPRKIRLKKKLLSNIVYNSKIAKRFHDVQYYETMAVDTLLLPYRKDEKKRYRSRRRGIVTAKILRYRSRLEEKAEGVFDKLGSLFKNNSLYAFERQADPPINSNLLYLTSSVPMLITAYRKIRKNKGAMTPAWTISNDRHNRMNAQQKRLLIKGFKAPDGMSNKIFLLTSRLLRKGLYPWGASRRIYIDKPGQPGKLRPITIPPFMDRVVQAAITMVLQAVYEPYFEKRNRSFGFRPSKGVHDAIHALTNMKARGLTTAIEGDIQAAYDKVNRKKLILILGKKIKDRKFLQLIEKRLEYQYWDVKKGAYVEEDLGIPQGGIDSPYLWNIYMMEFDDFVHEHTGQLFEELNQKVRGTLSSDRKIPQKEKRKYEKMRTGCKFLISQLNKNAQNHELLNRTFNDTGLRVKLNFKRILVQLKWDLCYKNKMDTNTFKYAVMRQLRHYNRLFNRLPANDPSKKYLRFIYCRYADDWIILTNAPVTVLNKLKETYKEFLANELSATLADQKTLITDIRKRPAHFLGFELRTTAQRKLIKLRRSYTDASGAVREIRFKARAGGAKVWALPDRQRLISRLNMKGYCNKKGYPNGVKWLAGLEPFAIIERFNSVIRGLTNFYTEFVQYPGRSLSRWYYILKYSCLKTFAQKYKTTIAQIYRKFRARRSKRFALRYTERTIEVTIQHNFDGDVLQKRWRLITLKEALEKAKAVNRLYEVETKFWKLEAGEPVFYERNPQRIPAITDDKFLDSIKWVNLRTRASFDLPCCICGKTDDVEMHHIKAIRKKKYTLIPAAG